MEIKQKTKFFFIIFTLVLFTTCTKYELAPVNPDKQLLLDLVNDYRTSGCNCGSEYYPPVNTVKWNDTLEIAAQNHSNYMNKNNNLDHSGSDGSSAGDRINSAGYSWSTYGENIAVGYSTEKAVVEGWIKSTGHCKNIMNENFLEMGVATSGAYWTQVFATH